MSKRKYCDPTIEILIVECECNIAAGSIETGGGQISVANETIEESKQNWTIDLE